MTQEKKFVYTWIIFGILVLALIIFQSITINSIKEEIGTLEEQTTRGFSETTQRLGQIQEESAKRDENLSLRIDASADILMQEIAQRDIVLGRRIAGVENQVNRVEETNQKLQEQIIDLNIQSQDFTTIINDALKSVVSITTDTGIGSGVIVDGDGYVLTNYHVLQGASAAAVKVFSGESYGVSVVATNPQADLALLRLRNTGSKTFTKLTFADKNNIKAGTKVIALGSPAGLEFTVTEGIISATDRTNEYGVAVIQTDVPINPGNSGGPILNIQKTIVGISTYKASGFESLGFAVSAEVAEDFVEEAIANDQQG